DARRKILLQLVDGLEALHTNQVLHRDIKSENAMVLKDGTAKLMDLGIVLDLTDEAATMHTQVKDFIGSIRFASPQFVRGEKFAPEDDIYGLGTIAFELATGERVYDGVERKTLLPTEILQRPPT